MESPTPDETGRRTPIFGGWREQYDRMLRSQQRLVGIAEGQGWASSDRATDALFHFFQDAYHLREWIVNDTDLEPRVTWVEMWGSLRVCADLANGVKHRDLKSPHVKEAQVGFTRQDVTVKPGPVGSPGEPAEHGWTVEVVGGERDAVELANQVVRDWQAWLRAEEML